MESLLLASTKSSSMHNEAKVLPWSHVNILSEPAALVGLFDSIPALVAYIDCNMVLQFCNQQFRSWFSLHGDVAGKSFPLVAGKQIFDQLQRHMGKVLVGDRAHFQMFLETDNGFQCLDATLSPDFDNKRKVRGFIFHSADVTEKNRTERALKDYFENASIGLHWVDANGIIIWANPAELKMLGYTEDEYIGHHIAEFHTNKVAINDIIHQLFQRQKIINCDAELLCKDGASKHVTINSTALWEGDKFIHTRCFTIDVTEQKRAAKAVMESEERFRMMAHLAPLVIWTTDEHGDFNFLSIRWEQITGKPAEEGLGRLWSNFIHPDDRNNIMDSWSQSYSSKRPFEGKFRIANAAGGYQVTYVNSIPRYNGAGGFEGYIGILQDISSDEQVKHSLEKIVLERTEDLKRRNDDLKRAERALQEKNQELQEINNELSSFAQIASHDLQEPLRKIQTFSNRLFEFEGNKFSDKGKELHERILESSGRMRNLIKDLLAYSKSNGDGQKLETLNLNLLLDEVISELEVKIGEKKAKIVNLGLPEVDAIRFQFHQLFLNLLSNALKFSKTGTDPHIVFQSETVRGIEGNVLRDEMKLYHCISVSDNGIGFDHNSSEKIFEMFQRLHNRDRYDGTGIGLAICKKIVENHKGKILAQGRANIGATFKIYLPVKNIDQQLEKLSMNENKSHLLSQL